MKKILPAFLLSALLVIGSVIQTKAQTTDLLAGNILNGAITGSILGLSVMGLQDDGDFGPLRVGLGAGILAGGAFAVYDLTTLPQGQQFFISGTFNDGNNSSIILLLDTIYGAALGAVLSSAVMLIADEPQVDGLQYGSSIGAWVGFGFGLFDTFVLAQRNRDFMASKLLDRDALVEVDSGFGSFNFLSPQIASYTDLSGNRLKAGYEPALQVFRFSTRF
ncbi:MAG: hypothetical protein ACNA78_10420 [Balneolaceae bacterium]